MQNTKRSYRKCLQVGCKSEKLIARGLCNSCYQKHVRRGTINQFQATLKRDVSPLHLCDSHDPSGVCYSKCGCRCAGCKEKRRLERAKQIAQQFRTPDWVDGKPFREHLLSQLSKDGVTLAVAASESGVSYSTLYNLKTRRSRRLKIADAAMLAAWHGTGWCETCGKGVRAYGPGRWCFTCLNQRQRNKKREQHAA